MDRVMLHLAAFRRTSPQTQASYSLEVYALQHIFTAFSESYGSSFLALVHTSGGETYSRFAKVGAGTLYHIPVMAQQKKERDTQAHVRIHSLWWWRSR